VKKPEVRRQELLDIAMEMCQEVGWDQMSVEAITTRANVAKGTFYHYFKSKDEVRLALGEQFSEELFGYMREATQEAVGPAVERLRHVLDASIAYKTRYSARATDLISYLYSDQNIVLRTHLVRGWIETTRAFVKPIVELAQQDGSFVVDDVDSTCDLILMLWFHYSDALWHRAQHSDDFVGTLLTGSKAMLAAQGRMLGLPADTFTIDIEPAAEVAIENLSKAG
jgi:AcrR family transcriptional regulator